MTIEQIGCCGAYCRTCKVYTQNSVLVVKSAIQTERGTSAKPDARLRFAVLKDTILVLTVPN